MRYCIEYFVNSMIQNNARTRMNNIEETDV